MCNFPGNTEFIGTSRTHCNVFSSFKNNLIMWFSISGIITAFIGTSISLWTIIMRDERIAGTWRDIPNLHKNAIKERRCVLAGIGIMLLGNILQIAGYFFP